MFRQSEPLRRVMHPQARANIEAFIAELDELYFDDDAESCGFVLSTRKFVNREAHRTLESWRNREAERTEMLRSRLGRLFGGRARPMICYGDRKGRRGQVIVSDRGERWLSRVLAAAALGVSQSQVRTALMRGYRCEGRLLWLEGKPMPKEREKVRGRPIVRDDGVEYPSIARAIGENGTRSKNTRRCALEAALRNGRRFEGHYYTYAEAR